MKFESILGNSNTTTVGDLVGRCPETAAVFGLYGGDNIRSASYTLAQFAEAYEVEKSTLCRALFDVYMAVNPLEDMPSTELLALLARDYVAVREEELAKLHRLARKIEAVHRDSPVLPKGITLLVKALQQMLAEQVPRAELNADALPADTLHAEHEAVRAHIQKIRACTTHYEAPEEACRSWRRLYAELQALDTLLAEQIYLEQDILLPRMNA